MLCRHTPPPAPLALTRTDTFNRHPAQVEDALDKLCDKLPSPQGEATVDCSKLDSYPNVSFTLNGHPFELTPKEWVMEVCEGGECECISGFMGIDLPPQLGELIILGDVFIRNYYSIFDYGNKKMQFGTAV